MHVYLCMYVRTYIRVWVCVSSIFSFSLPIHTYRHTQLSQVPSPRRRTLVRPLPFSLSLPSSLSFQNHFPTFAQTNFPAKKPFQRILPKAPTLQSAFPFTLLALHGSQTQASTIGREVFNGDQDSKTFFTNTTD